jgi:hypothetical protein
MSVFDWASEADNAESKFGLAYSVPIHCPGEDSPSDSAKLTVANATISFADAFKSLTNQSFGRGGIYLKLEGNLEDPTEGCTRSSCQLEVQCRRGPSCSISLDCGETGRGSCFGLTVSGSFCTEWVFSSCVQQDQFASTFCSLARNSNWMWGHRSQMVLFSLDLAPDTEPR